MSTKRQSLSVRAATSVALATFALVGACQNLATQPMTLARGMLVRQADYGATWPFSVPQGVIGCGNPLTTVFQANGKNYGIAGCATECGFAPASEILIDPNDSTRLSQFLEQTGLNARCAS